jgi:hypothetical protein
MKVKPASVHFRANVGFSLNCQLVSPIGSTPPAVKLYKSVAGMNTLATLLLCDLYYAVSIEIRGRVAKVHGIWRAERVL